ncbi:uncharacterized protein LOC110465056 isoform X2 [Mizuhopecten yessoensis]|uniref:uncharacterized protein LOC110465056 isoform X2 n=1 Tax=Mizuhopecten yessoensis TaxID=6573 RepID=UPI000B459BB9|nr:uncharacterized protein LOC110465056 isoform X2 [Mizuhopecten yessoensis]
MGNDYSCDVHSKHNSYAERDACVRKRTTNSEIEALKLKHNLRFTCNSGHAHRDRKEVLDCHDFELRKHFISTCGRELTRWTACFAFFPVAVKAVSCFDIETVRRRKRRQCDIRWISIQTKKCFLSLLG